MTCWWNKHQAIRAALEQAGVNVGPDDFILDRSPSTQQYGWHFWPHDKTPRFLGITWEHAIDFIATHDPADYL